MAAGDTLKGRRLPALDHEFPKLEEPGDYGGPIYGFTGDKPAVFFLKPNARDPDAPARARGFQHVTSPPHVFTEEDDGTLTIAKSIGDTARGASESDGWHGYLEQGTWRQV